MNIPFTAHRVKYKYLNRDCCKNYSTQSDKINIKTRVESDKTTFWFRKFKHVFISFVA